jgi:hypothetical protein
VTTTLHPQAQLTRRRGSRRVRRATLAVGRAILANAWAAGWLIPYGAAEVHRQLERRP